MPIVDKKYNTLQRLNNWDRSTQYMISERLKNEVGIKMEFTFFTRNEGLLLARITDILIGQKLSDKYIKIAEVIDHGLDYCKKGIRYGKNPWPGDFYKKGLFEFEKEFKRKSFKKESKMIAEKMTENAKDFITVFLKKVLFDSVEIFYSHPHSWSEMGFPGPAFPEGYPFLKCTEKEEWEPEFKNNKNEK